MAIFPNCKFEILLGRGGIIPGQKAAGKLVLHVPAKIPRAEHITFEFVSAAYAVYSSGKSSVTHTKQLYRGSFQIDLPGVIDAGTHEYEFWLDVPAWLPVAFKGQNFGVTHIIQTTLDVDWALDPKEKVVPVIALSPREGEAKPLITRSPAGFHKEIVLEATLESTVVVVGQPLRGTVALRSGHEARFDYIDLSFMSAAQMVFGRGDVRAYAVPRIFRIPADALRAGESVPFEVHCPAAMLPTLHNAFINHDGYFQVRAIIPWASDPAFSIKLDVLPAGSSIAMHESTAVVGNARLSSLAAAMALASGLQQGRGRELVFGEVGPVHVRISDGPRGAQLGVDVDLVYPELQLDIEFSKQSAVAAAFGRSKMLPDHLAGYSLQTSRESAEVKRFFDEVLALPVLEDIRLSDHHLGFHVPLENDDGRRMNLVAIAARTRAQGLERAIAMLPYPSLVLGSRPAWQATASEQNAFLVPTGPSLHGIRVAARIMGGEERSLVASIRTVTTHDGLGIRCDLDLREAALPSAAMTEVEDDAEPKSEMLRSVRAVFRAAHVLSSGSAVTLESATWTPDPRALLPVLEAFLSYAIESRGERRVDSPYR